MFFQCLILSLNFDYCIKKCTLCYRLESIIDFRLKELRAKVAVIEKFETQVETLTQVAKDLEGKLPEALEQGLKQNRPEVLMVTIF